MAGLLASQASEAAIARFFGWGYSDNQKYKNALAYFDSANKMLGLVGKIPQPLGAKIAIARVLIDVIDPASFEGIVSGRVTLDFDPSIQVAAAGWFGEFGANPALPAPPIPLSPTDNYVDLLQLDANPAMASSSVTTSAGQVVFDFNWGAPGFVPAANMDTEGHFNFAGLYLYSPSFAGRGLQPEVDAGPSVISVAGSPGETLALGTDSPTYMLCTSNYCGVNPIPEPSVAWLMFGGLALLPAMARRANRRRD